MSEGILSAQRTIGGHGVVQITAPISPGSSGGAVLDGRGRVFAVWTAHLQGGQQLNFAVPLRAGLDLLVAANTLPRSIATVFKNVPSDALSAAAEGGVGGGTAGGLGASCGSSGFATVALGDVLGHLRTAKVWATTPAQRGVIAELEVQVIGLIESEPLKTPRSAAYLTANAGGTEKVARDTRRRMLDSFYKDYPTIAEQAIEEASTQRFRFEMEDVASGLDPRQPPRCASARWEAVQALALRAAAL